MALTNLILTIAGVSAVVLLMRSDLKQSAPNFKRNVKYIRSLLEEGLSKTTDKAKPKELDTQALKKEIPKEDK